MCKNYRLITINGMIISKLWKHEIGCIMSIHLKDQWQICEGKTAVKNPGILNTGELAMRAGVAEAI